MIPTLLKGKQTDPDPQYGNKLIYFPAKISLRAWKKNIIYIYNIYIYISMWDIMKKDIMCI